MNTTNQEQKKWYDSTGLLIVLFFILPPVGIYGVLKRKTSTFKKILYIIPAILLSLFGFLFILSQLFPIDSYKDGLDYYHKGDYETAIKNFSLVKENEEMYEDALLKIEMAKQKISEKQI